MDNAVVIALIGVLPQLVLVIVGAVLVALYHREIGQFVSTHVGSVSGFGLRFDLIKPSEIDKAVNERVRTVGLSPIVPNSRQISERAARLAQQISGRTVLWVDDDPNGNRLERRLLNNLGLFVEIARSNEEASAALRDDRIHIDLVISDIERSIGESGKELVRRLAEITDAPRLIYYIRNLDTSLGTPAGAFCITNRPDVLLDFVMDALDRLPPRGEH